MTPERFRRIRRVLQNRVTDLTVLMEQVNKSHNFSAIVRTCDAVGVAKAHAVIGTESSLKVHHYTAGGAGRWVDVVVHEAVDDAAAALKGQGLRLVAAHRSTRSRPIHEIDLTVPTAVMVGAELDGISERGLALADEVLEIPMVGMVGSLNVSVATALVLYEALRQRAASPEYRPARIAAADQKRMAVEWAYPKLTEICRRKGLPYPEVDEDGYLAPGGS